MLGLGFIVGGALGFCLSARDFEEKLKVFEEKILAVKMEAKTDANAVSMRMEAKKDNDAVLMEDILLAEERVKKMLDRASASERSQ